MPIFALYTEKYGPGTGHEPGTMGSALAVYAFYAADGCGFTTLPLYTARERMLACSDASASGVVKPIYLFI